MNHEMFYYYYYLILYRTVHRLNNHKFTKTGKIPHTKKLSGMVLTKTSFIKHLYCYQTP